MSAAETLITEYIGIWSPATKAKSSAGRGGGKKEEFYGTKKLRELILELAVRGLLVGQDSKDEPASELLKRIATERLRLIKRGDVKKQKTLPPLSAVEAQFAPPRGWEWTRLQEVSEYIQRGKGPMYSDEGSVRVVSQKCIQWSGFDLDAARFVADESLDQYGQERFLRANDLLWNSTGTGTVGRINRIDDVVVNTLVADSHVTVVRTLGFNSKFLCSYIASAGIQSRVMPTHEKSLVSGTTNQVELNTSSVTTLPIPLPPLAEQQRIVAKVDELMALRDQLEQQQEDAARTHDRLVQVLLDTLTTAIEGVQYEQAWQRIESNFDALFTTESSIDRLKNTILQLAVMGKLVEQNLNDQPAAKLIQLIARDRAAAIDAKQMRKPQAIEPYEGNLPYELPSTWIWTQVGQLAAAEDNAICDGPFGSKLKTSHYIDEKGFAVIRLGNIGIGEFIWGKEGYISEDHFRSLSGNQTKAGDLIVAGMAEPLVRCCEVPPELGPAINKADCFRVRLHEAVDRTYVRHFFNSPVAKVLADQENHGMTRQRINLGNAKALPIPVPPIIEQRRIVAKVNELMTLCDRLMASLRTAQSIQVNLADSLVEAAVR